MTGIPRNKGPVAIDVEGLTKSFRILHARPDTLKERVLHPFRREYTRLDVLDDVDFRVHRGEFFGIVGRNGSGKSTLLKILASIYGADRGHVRVAGRVAPIIELGVGFQPELTARENVVLNGLMLGLSARESRLRFDAVVDFAELHDFLDLKLKNYSSGMRLRLAFAMMLQSDPDVMLLDEVLAVGDPGFQQKCAHAFDEFRARGEKTVILVSQNVGKIETECDRALLLMAGRVESQGDPAEVGARYMDLVTAGAPAARVQDAGERASLAARIAKVRLLDASGERTRATEAGDPLRFHVTAESDQPLHAPHLVVRIGNPEGASLFAPPPIDLGSYADVFAHGDRVGVATRIENKLAPGPYIATFALAASNSPGGENAVSDLVSFDFDILPNGRADSGLIALDYSVRLRREPRR